MAQSFLDEGDIEVARRAKMARGSNRFQLARSLADTLDTREALPLIVLGTGPWMAEYRRYMAAAGAWSKLPWNAAPPPRPSRWYAFEEGKHSFVQSVTFKRLLADAQDEMFVAALALQAWRAEHGRYPETLDALVPDILEAAPADPFAGAPLKYRRDGETYVLYSVGPDGRDDGGEPAAIQDKDTGKWRYNALSLESRGDIVWVTSQRLFNVDRP
jgi:hypothetical protein